MRFLDMLSEIMSFGNTEEEAMNLISNLDSELITRGIAPSFCGYGVIYGYNTPVGEEVDEMGTVVKQGEHYISYVITVEKEVGEMVFYVVGKRP